MQNIKNLQLNHEESQDTISNSNYENNESKLNNSFEKQLQKKISSSDESIISSSDITFDSESDGDNQNNKILEKKSNYVKVK